MPDPFKAYLKMWGLRRDGEAIITFSSSLLPVTRAGDKLMLKVAQAPEEIAGGAILAAWQNGPFVRVIDCEGPALLMERAIPEPLLTDMAASNDAEATRIICEVVDGIHQTVPEAVALEPLEVRFRALDGAADSEFFRVAQQVAAELLSEPQDARPLHGDIHHGNILWFGQGGWRAIDPKGVLGERGFDYANLFCNPSTEIAGNRAQFEARVTAVSDIANIPADRLCRWVLAWSGLSAVWSMEDEQDPSGAFKIGEIARACLS